MFAALLSSPYSLSFCCTRCSQNMVLVKQMSILLNRPCTKGSKSGLLSELSVVCFSSNAKTVKSCETRCLLFTGKSNVGLSCGVINSSRYIGILPMTACRTFHQDIKGEQKYANTIHYDSGNRVKTNSSNKGNDYQWTGASCEHSHSNNVQRSNVHEHVCEKKSDAVNNLRPCNSNINLDGQCTCTVQTTFFKYQSPKYCKLLQTLNKTKTVSSNSQWRNYRNLLSSTPDILHGNLGSFGKLKGGNYTAIYRSVHSTCRNGDIYRNDVSETFVIRKKPPWRIVFFGTDEIATLTLKALHENMKNHPSPVVESLEVVTIKQQRAVRNYAESVQLDIHDWPIKPSPGKYDVGVLVSFGHLIPDSLIHMCPYGILNMHPSLLPRWRGASPIIHTILNGDAETGISVMEIRPKHFDIGPLLLQRLVPLPHRATSFQLVDMLGRIGAGMVLECLADLPTMERLEHEQNQKGITYAHKLSHKNANVDWENQTSYEVDCQYRAIHELMPLRSEWKGHTVKLLEIMDPVFLKDIDHYHVKGYEGDITLADPGTVAFHRKLKCLLIKCKAGIVGFRKIVIKKPLSAQDFYNGYLLSTDDTRLTSLHNDLNKYVKQERVPMKKVMKL